MKKGNNFETAIKTLKPPVFWKEKESFQKHCTKWPLESIEKKISSRTKMIAQMLLRSKYGPWMSHNKKMISKILERSIKNIRRRFRNMKMSNKK